MYPPTNRYVQPSLASRTLFGIPPAIAPVDAREQLRGLQRLFESQMEVLKSTGRKAQARGEARLSAGAQQQERPPDRDSLIEDLDLMRAWFEPTAKGARVREMVSSVPPVSVDLPYEGPLLVVNGGHGRRIVTPEGRALISCLKSALDDYQSCHLQVNDDEDDWVTLRDDDVAECSFILLDKYRSWARRRLDDVVGLLTSETSTL